MAKIEKALLLQLPEDLLSKYALRSDTEKESKYASWHVSDFYASCWKTCEEAKAKKGQLNIDATVHLFRKEKEARQQFQDPDHRWALVSMLGFLHCFPRIVEDIRIGDDCLIVAPTENSLLDSLACNISFY